MKTKLVRLWRIKTPFQKKHCIERIVRYFVMITIISMFLSSRGFSGSLDSLSTYYTRGLSTESWRGGFVYQSIIFSRYKLYVSEILSSSCLELSPTANKWKDQHYFLLDLTRTINQKFSAKLMGKSLTYSDKQSGYPNDIRTQFIGVGAEYKEENFKIPLLLGIKRDQRFKQSDQGASYRISVDNTRFELASYINRFHTAYEEDDLQRRKNNTFTISYLVNRTFQKGTSDSLKLSMNHQRRDYYISESGEIENREEKEQKLENFLTYKISHRFLCRIRGTISTRSLRINLLNNSQKKLKRQRKDFYTSGDISLYFKISSIRARASLAYLGEEQKYLVTETLPSSPYSGNNFLITPDNQSAYTTLSLQTWWQFSKNDSLIFTSYLQRFRYDTPDPTNFDDRDELRFHTDIREIHTFSPCLALHLNVSLNLLHFVYIYGEKSADNNWTRILRLSPTLFWSPIPRWRFSHSTEVLINTVDYDYESMLPSIRSFLYRKFQLEDSVRVSLTPRVSLRLFYRLELDENGKFLWDRWTEQKLADRVSRTVTVSMNYRPGKTINISPGYTFYSRRGYRYKVGLTNLQEKNIMLVFKSYGPILRIGYTSENLRFILAGNTIITNTPSTKKKILTRFNLGLSWIL